MLRITCTLLLLLAAGLLPQTIRAQGTPAEKAVLAFSEKKNKWLTAALADSIAWMLDTRCQYIHSNGWVQSADEVVQDLKTKKLVYNSIKISESKARQYDNMVVITGRGHFTGRVGERPFDMQLAFTEVYIRRKGGWKLVSRHSNRLEAPQG